MESPESIPELIGKNQNEPDSATIRETIITSSWDNDQKMGLKYAVAVIAANIRRQHPHAGLELEREINRLAIEDPEIKKLFEELTKAEA